jgi:hypothetical protein
MQNGYRYLRSEPIGRDLGPELRPEPASREMLRPGECGGKSMTDTPKKLPKIERNGRNI